jgi:hypothetical protein
MTYSDTSVINKFTLIEADSILFSQLEATGEYHHLHKSQRWCFKNIDNLIIAALNDL